MKNFFQRITACFLLMNLILALQGCSSAAKKGAKALESKDYDTALGYLDAAVSKKPNDPKLKSQRQEARAGWLGNRLLEARAARVGNQLDRALDTLLVVTEKSKEWGTPARGAAVFTAEEETGLAWSDLKTKLGPWIERGQPMRSYFYLVKYAPVFGVKKLEHDSYRKASVAAARNQCKLMMLEREAKDGFYGDWINKTCLVFGVKSGLSATRLSEKLYSKINLELDADSLPASVRTRFRTGLESGFTASPWYLASGQKVMKVMASSEFIQKLEPEAFFQTHRYKERVEGQTEPVERELKYPATRTRQFLSVAISVHFTADEGVFLKDAERDESRKEGVSHKERRAELGIYPEAFQPIDQAAWVLERVNRLLGRVQESYKAVWITEMCKEQESLTPAELASQCLYGAREGASKQAYSWLLGKTGLTVPQYFGIF